MQSELARLRELEKYHSQSSGSDNSVTVPSLSSNSEENFDPHTYKWKGGEFITYSSGLKEEKEEEINAKVLSRMELAAYRQHVQRTTSLEISPTGIMDDPIFKLQKVLLHIPKYHRIHLVNSMVFRYVT